MDNYIDSNKYEIAHADTCLPDYWGGHHLAHFAIPVDCLTTFKDVRDSLANDLEQGALAGSVDWEVIESDHFYTKTKAAINRIRPLTKHAKLAFPDLEPFEDDCESVYAYFVIVAE